MFSKLFGKPIQSQPPLPSSSQSKTHKNMASSDLAPRVVVHYGIPSTASIIAFDPIQCLLAIGTLDGRIKVIGGDNIEGLLISPKALPFKNLEFLQNQGFLVSVSNENEIQVWDLENRCISSNIQWESNITAFSVIPTTHYIYVGDEYGFLSVLKYDSEEGKILQLPYHIPPNLIAEGAEISLSDHQSIVGVLAQPHSCGNRVLIAYDNGVIILWDVTEDRAVHVRGYKDLQLKEGTVVNISNNESRTYQNNLLDNNEQEDKEISSLCWVSPDGSILAVGYVDGDILLWNLSDSVKGQNSTNDVVKIQLSSNDRRLPVIVLHWCSNKTQNGGGGQLIAYGGEDIGSEEVLTILNLDWSSGLVKLKCVDRFDLSLHGSFADVTVTSHAYGADSSSTSLFILTNPGQLHFYDFDSLSDFKSGMGHNHLHSVQYRSVISTVEPYMTVGKLYLIGSGINLSETVSPAKVEEKWPLTGGIPSELSISENKIERIYIGGYQDGSIRIWNATYPVLSLVSVLGLDSLAIESIQVAGARAPVSTLDFCSTTFTLAIGNANGSVCLYKLQGNSYQTTVTIIADTRQDAYIFPPEAKNRCSAVFSTLDSPVRALQFVKSGIRLVAGFECGKVVMLDASALSVLFVTDCVSSPVSPIISLAVNENSESAVEVIFILTRDAHLVLINSTTGNTISSHLIHPTENSTAVSMHVFEAKNLLTEISQKNLMASSRNPEAETHQNLRGSSEFEDPKQPPHLVDETQASQILILCEDSLYMYSLTSIIQGDRNFLNVLNLEKPCSWTTIYKKNAEEYGFVLVYQTGEIDIRSLPDLELVGNTSMMSLLRWSFKNNMEKTMSSSENGQIVVANGCEFAFISLLAFENEFRIPESLPSFHDEALAAAADADGNFSQNQKKTQSAMPGFISNMIKGLKGEPDMNYIETREIMISRLDKMFSRLPFSNPFNVSDQEDLELLIEDLDIDEPLVVVSSSQQSTIDVKGKDMEREKLFEGGSSDTNPKVRTREEIIAKYRKSSDAAGAASQAKDKLLERQEKLDKLSRRTEELQSGAENFASMAQELAKTMEKRKWWNI